MVQRSRAEPVGRLLQCPVSRLADDAVDEQATMLLEGADGLVQLGVEDLEDTCRPVVRSSPAPSSSPNAASEARISVTAALRSPQRRASPFSRRGLDIPRALRDKLTGSQMQYS